MSRGDRQQLHLQDLALAQDCSRGCAAAWDRFTERFGRRLYAIGMAIAGDHSIARELADSIYGDIFESKLATYSGRGPLEAWLKAVMSQAYIDRYRAERRVVSLDEHIAELPQMLCDVAPEQSFPQRDARLDEAVTEVFRALPAEERYLLAAYFFDQRTLAEIARVLGVHESTVSRRLDRLTKRLRRRITRLLPSPADVGDLSLDLRRALARE